MKLMVAGLVLGATAIASAEPPLLPESAYEWRKPNTSGVSLEIGSGWERLDAMGVTHGVTYRARYARFSPQVSISKFLYVGAALQVGSVYDSYGSPDDPLMVPIILQVSDRSSGTIFSPQLVLGARAIFGIFSTAGEVAPTLRWISIGSTTDYLSDSSFQTTIELHGRADVWATPHFSAGVMVGIDTSALHDLMGGLQVAFHLEPYDTMKR